jgi:hypothetical protein
MTRRTTMSKINLKLGHIYFDPEGKTFAKVDSFGVRDDEKYVVFALWLPRRPGWQEGAALGIQSFLDTYTEGPVTQGEVEAFRVSPKFRITATYEYEVDLESFKNWGFGDNPTVDEMLEIEQDQMWETMSDALTGSDDVKLEIKVVTDNG